MQTRRFHSSLARARSALAMLLLAGPATAGIAVGPLNPDSGFPEWYEDQTGLRLELCLDPNACLVPLPNPAAPVSFPDNFPDEAFYWAADALMDGPANPGIGVNQAVNARLVLAREAAFATGPVIPGEQIVFSRIRFVIDGYPGLVGHTYRITHPYGTQDFAPTGGGGGGGGTNADGYSATFDVGLAIGQFAEATAVFPTFLIPASFDRNTLIASPGTFLDTGAGIPVPASGSPTGNNFFRIEGPNIGLLYPDYQCADPTLGIGGPNGGGVKDGFGNDVLTDCVETDLFTFMGRVAVNQGLDIERAAYGKLDTDPNPNFVLPRSFVSVWARSSAGQSLEAQLAGGTPVPMIEGEAGHYFAQLVEGSDYPLLPPGTLAPGAVVVTNTGDNPPTAKSATPTAHLSFDLAEPPSWDAATGTLTLRVRLSNEIDPSVALSLSATPGMTLTGGWTELAPGDLRGVFTTGPVPPWSVTVTTADGLSATSRVLLATP